MSFFQRIAPLAATLLLGAVATAAQAEPATPGSAASQAAAPQPQGDPQPHANAAPQESLRIGLADSDTKLVLPWFVTELTDAVNQGKSLNDTGKALVNGL